MDKSYILLALAAIALFILALSTLTVAVALLMKETYHELVVVSEIAVEGAIELSEWWSFMKFSGAF